MSALQTSNGEKKAGNGVVDPRRRSLLDLAPLELDCMNTLWPIGEGTVREIRDQLAPRRPRAYTTIMTIMDRLARKGIVERRKSGRAYIYRPSLSIEDARTHALGQIVESFFGGSREIAAAYLRDGGSVRQAESLDARPALALAASASASAGVARSASVAVNPVAADSVANSVSNPAADLAKAAAAPDGANLAPPVADLTPVTATRTRNSSDDAPPIDATLL
jgi:BlaI family transcriptional regulator, penicillinase repressor